MTRPRLQLHLSTLLIVTLLAAGWVWLNVREYLVLDQIAEAVPIGPESRIFYETPCRGFPVVFERLDTPLFVGGSNIAFLLLNIFIGILVCGGVAVCCEAIARLPPSKHRFHWATASVLLLLAVALLLLNLTLRQGTPFYYIMSHSNSGPDGYTERQGWPLAWRELQLSAFWINCDMRGLIVDLGLALFTMIVVGVITESIIRRRSKP